MKTTCFYFASLMLSIISLSSVATAEPLYSVNGKTVSEQELSTAMKMKFHEIAEENFHKKEAMIDNAIFDQYIEDQVKKTGKARAEVESKLFDVKDPTDKETKKWYDENKHRIPPQYKFDEIKEDIKRQIKSEKQKENYASTIAKIKKDQKVKILLQAPIAPQVTLKTEGYPTKGNKSSKVTIVEFADYQCPHCKEAGIELKKVMKKYSDKVQLIFMDFPINRSGISEIVAQGAVCADEQGKYWEYHDLAFEKQNDLTKESPKELAKSVKIDVAKFEACLKTKKPAEKVKLAKSEGDRVGVAGTPTIFIDGRKVHGYDEGELIEAIEKAL